MPKPAPPVEVDLEVSSWVEGRGVRHSNWSVRLKDAWIPIAELRDVAATVTDPEVTFHDEVDERVVLPPGCQYRKTYHPWLPIGTRVLKRVSVPRDANRTAAHGPTPTAATLQQVLAAFPAIKQPLKTTVTELRVDRNGRLVSELEWQARHADLHRRSAPVRAPSFPANEDGDARTKTVA
jgi:hypothetical protein